MRSVNSRFVSSIVLLAFLSASFAGPAFARSAGAAGAAGGGSSGGGSSGGGGTVTLAREVPPHRVTVIAPDYEAKYSGCQYDNTGRLTWSPTGQPCPDTGN
jgi:hypothetical protein